MEVILDLHQSKFLNYQQTHPFTFSGIKSVNKLAWSNNYSFIYQIKIVSYFISDLDDLSTTDRSLDERERLRTLPPLLRIPSYSSIDISIVDTTCQYLYKNFMLIYFRNIIHNLGKTVSRIRPILMWLPLSLFYSWYIFYNIYIFLNLI